jgi:cysteinyl-tRNA synthetase, unknown class
MLKRSGWSGVLGRTGLLCSLVFSVALLMMVPNRAGAQTRRAAETATRAEARADARTEARAQSSRRAALRAARSWGYQLRIKDLEPLYASDPDLLVIDHGLAARRDGKLLFDAAEIERLKVRTDGRRRIVLSYLSIGEAEQYRYYWRETWCTRATAPAWVGAVNPNWPGNYPARFWDPDWQDLIVKPEDGYIAKIRSQGFDGIYLDRTDVWSEWTTERPTAERDMIKFLERIAGAARARDANFLVVMQNAEELLAHRAVRRLLDGVAKEDLLHGTNFSQAPNDAATVATAVAQLRPAKTDRIPVFAVEYLSDPAVIEAARKRLAGFGFVPTFAPRLLDRLGPEPAGADVAKHAPTGGAAPRSEQRSTTWGEGGPTCLLD